MSDAKDFGSRTFLRFPNQFIACFLFLYTFVCPLNVKLLLLKILLLIFLVSSKKDGYMHF